uniref:Tyrosine-protein kinase receptor Tie-1 n=1 Tax=Melanaphis sacchari TaxID=742174 RepID=A0A2H8TRV2_9HEMI
MLLLPAICFLLCVDILNASNKNDLQKQNITISFHSHKNNCSEDYDITTIYRFRKMGSSTKYSLTNSNGENYYLWPRTRKNWREMCTIEIHSRTNAIGIPLSINKTIDDNNSTSDNVLQINTAGLLKYGFTQNNSRIAIYFNSIYWIPSAIESTGKKCDLDSVTSSTSTENTENQSNKCFQTLEYKYESHYYQHYTRDVYQTFLTVDWKPIKKQNCLSITYFHNLNSNMKIILSISNENDTLIASPILEKHDSITTLKVENLNLIQDQEYKLSLKSKYANMHSYYSGDFRNWFEFLRIAQCPNNDEEEVTLVSMNDIGHNNLCISQKPFVILGNDENSINNKTSTTSCLNGGYMLQTKSTCVCPPGFIGQFCEKGCGPNHYGADCKGVCSMYTDEMCRGLLMCTKYYGCTCPVGLTGSLCDRDCPPGKYGANCEQSCSSNCLDRTCDPYTGICYRGCSQGYSSPYCLQKYPYLINPPILLSDKYETLEMELNFGSNNIKGGDNILKLKYYQLLYKSIIEEEFTKSEFKIIIENNTRTTDILNNLEPDTTYIIGVLVIADDGNFNYEDIVYGQYNTSCIQPEITDYNIQLISGIKSVNVRWDKINLKRFECKVIKYILTLMFNQSKNQISGIKEIETSSDNGYLIENLYPGYNYSLSLTSQTNKGPMMSSPTYSFIPLITKNDVSIKDLVATTTDDKIKISWKLKNVYEQHTIVHEPFTYIIRFKLHRILSCSLENLENDWTSVIISNRTNYEIFDVVPNAQYCIQVKIASDEINTRETQIYVLTQSSRPKVEPVFDLEHPMYVTNSSIFIQWKIDHVNCSKLNGFLSTFYIELKDKQNNILQVNETKNNYIHINDLKSNNYYEIKVFIKTHMGYNPEHYLFTNFTTKTRYLSPVNDLVAYKKSLKYRLVGLRWYYIEDTSLDGFIVSINEDTFGKKNKVSVISPIKCPAWPEYYCYTYHNLSSINNFTFKIKPKSIDYPEGGPESSISFNINDELPDSPNNLKITDIGNTFISLQWDIPWIFNGILKMFIINVEEISYADMNLYSGVKATEYPIYEEVPSFNYTLKNLNPGSTYSVGIISVSKSLWYSLPSRILAKTLLD